MQNQLERMQQMAGMQRNMLRDYNRHPRGEQMQPEGMESVFPKQTPPGMAYIPMQQWEEPFDLSTGFELGTLFPVLDYPYQGGGDCV